MRINMTVLEVTNMLLDDNRSSQASETDCGNLSCIADACKHIPTMPKVQLSLNWVIRWVRLDNICVSQCCPLIVCNHLVEGVMLSLSAYMRW